jgi:hypothetical protein
MMHASRLCALLTVLTSFLAASVAFAQEDDALKRVFARELPFLGHRNWIAVVDSAYPSQTAPGIKMFCTGAEQIDVVRGVLAAVERSPHVTGVVFHDAELAFVPEKRAAGIDAYRRQLKQALAGRNATAKPHEEIIADLDEAGKTFHVLILKTTMTLPYTSVFVRLDCGYWSDESEQELRAAMQESVSAQ